MAKQKLTEQEVIRRETLQQLHLLGINPYPADLFEQTTNSQEILKQFDSEPDNFKQVSLAGRIMTRRIMGNASFAELQDSHGRIQVYFKRDDISPNEDKTMYNTVFKKLLDIGDIIGVHGYVFKTKMGETTIHVTSFKLLAKALRPLPVVKEKDGETFDAFTDPEQRYRQRYVDFLKTCIPIHCMRM